jgi:hypothetical protein
MRCVVKAWLTCGVPAAALAAPACRCPAQDGVFWSPTSPPRARYTIDCRFDPVQGTIAGSEVIRLRNTASEALSRLALDWPARGHQRPEVEVSGARVSPIGAAENADLPSVLVYDLPQPLEPGDQVEMRIDFATPVPSRDRATLHAWHPRLWWGFDVHNDFDVGITVPQVCALATSGRQDPESGRWRIEGASSFGLFIAKGHEVLEADADGVAVRCIFAPEARECADLLFATAADVVRFYRQRFGFYPHPCLSIVPGADQPMGGYPIATGLVAVHGQARMSEKPELHWKWITAHEIGHMYWGEHVMAEDSASWLCIGLGIHADREYVLARGLGLDKHRELFKRYTDGVRAGIDTTIDITPEQWASVDFDFNNVVIHGKGFGVVSALACTLGADTFHRICRVCLDELAGQQMGVREFRTVCERETGQDLGWFFDQWVRSARVLSYEIKSQECVEHKGQHRTRIEVTALGDLRMPVPVECVFDDGTSQVKFTERLLDVNTVEFTSKTPLASARLDPNEELPIIVPPPVTKREVVRDTRGLDWTGTGDEAVALLADARTVRLDDPSTWYKLGMVLFDGAHYEQALEAFRECEGSGRRDADAFLAGVWQGHVLDLLGRREEALKCYRGALEVAEGMTIRHDQYGLVSDRQWVEARIAAPFSRDLIRR